MKNMIQNYIKLMRPHHYLKNLLIFLPIIFSSNLLNVSKLWSVVNAFVTFSLLASSIYVLNDIRDVNLDKLHPKKKLRPISSGRISIKNAYIFLVLLLGFVIVLQIESNASYQSYAILGAYLLINILYSYGLKNVPIADVSILAIGFMLRVFYGADAVGVGVSKWLYLAILTFSFYLSLGKRRNEFRKTGTETRKVNRYYNQEFLDKNMYMSMCLTIIFYSLWTVDPTQTHRYLIWTVPMVLIIAMTYSLSVEKNDSDGDPINVLLGHHILLTMVSVYALVILSLIYIA